MIAASASATLIAIARSSSIDLALLGQPQRPGAVGGSPVTQVDLIADELLQSAARCDVHDASSVILIPVAQVRRHQTSES